MVARGDEEQGGGVGAGAVEAEQAGCAGGDERDDQVVEARGGTDGSGPTPAPAARLDGLSPAERV
jgi:hypothetical protein